MSRVAHIVVPGYPHHIKQRGNNKQAIFFVEDDRYVYLELLGAQGAKYGLRIDGYCLMTNHVHVIGTPAGEASLAKTLGRTHFLYAQYINRMHHRSGHLWQNRFYSCAMNDDYFLKALCYVELNPVRTGLADHAWSSAQAHCGDAPRNALFHLDDWRDRMPGETWREVLESFRGDGEAAGQIYRHTNTGRPLGSDSFLSRLEVVLGRRVRPLPIGRPKGWRKKK